MTDMQKWAVWYARIPTAYHSKRRAVVEAATARDAEELVARSLSTPWDYVIGDYLGATVEYVESVPIAGRVITMG